MSVGATAILETFRRTINATTPLVYSAVPYQEARGTGDLDVQMIRGDDVQRAYRLFARTDVEPAWWAGTLAEVRQTFVVQVLYHCPVALGGAQLAREMAGSDAGRLSWALTQNFDVEPAKELTSIEALRARNLQPLDNENWVAELEYTCTYFLGEETTQPEISP